MTRHQYKPLSSEAKKVLVAWGDKVIERKTLLDTEATADQDAVALEAARRFLLENGYKDDTVTLLLQDPEVIALIRRVWREHLHKRELQAANRDGIQLMYAVVEAERGHRANASRAAVKKVNEDRQTRAESQKRIARRLRDDLLRKDARLRLKGKKSELARRVRAAWPKNELVPDSNTIRHWFAEENKM